MSAPKKGLLRATEYTHELVAARLSPGDHTIDATVGNGHDTLFLARCVGEAGRVIGFDIQEKAITKTRERCTGYPQVQLHQTGHEKMQELVLHPVQAVLFNLGYLPSGNKDLITTADTTLPAVNSALQLLSPGGILTVVVYPGHPGGKEEAVAVEHWAGQLDQEFFAAAKYEFLNQKNSPPYLIVVERKT